MSIKLDSFLASFDPDIQAIVRQAHQLLVDSIPNVVETQDNENLGFGFDTGYRGLIFTLSPHQKHVTLGVADAVTLPDPTGLLEGTGKRHRHVKLRNTADLQNPALRQLITAAVHAKTGSG